MALPSVSLAIPPRLSLSLHPEGLRPERLLAYARLTMVAFSLAVAWLRPLEPVDHVTLVRALLVTYALYSAGLLMLVCWSPVPLRRPAARDVVDIIAISALAYLGLGVSGPLLPYLAFLLVATG